VEEFGALWEPTLTKPEYAWRIVEHSGRPVAAHSAAGGLRSPGLSRCGSSPSRGR
jgi:hypothetical protein